MQNMLVRRIADILNVSGYRAMRIDYKKGTARLPLLLISLLLLGCQSSLTTTGAQNMDTSDKDRQRILQIIDEYAHMGHGNAERFASLFWLDDPNLSNVENDRPGLLGPEYIRFLVGLVREGGERPVNQRFWDTHVYLLTPDVAYSVSMREELNVKKTSRVTFVYQKKHGEWRIIHGHFSYVPE